MKNKADDIEIEEEDTSSAIESPFNPKDVDISTKTLTIDLLVRRISRNEIDLFTEFQRGPDLWSSRQQSGLIESMLIRFPLPIFYFDGTDDSKWLVVDGLQRLSSINNFMVAKTLVLTELEFLPEFNNCTFDQLPRDLQRRLEETQVIAYIINPGTPIAVRYNLFKRINTGGLMLKPQEIRHALNQGIPADFVRDIANSRAFITATDDSISPRRMNDRDLVMRALAFMMFNYKEYKPPLDIFLGTEMSKLYTLGASKREELKICMLKALTTAYEIFGNDAFRKRTSITDTRNPINKGLFEVWVSQLSKLDDQQRSRLVESREMLLEKCMVKNSEKDFTNAITRATADTVSVLTRHKAIEQIMNEVLT
jgi:hypothetical protein